MISREALAARMARCQTRDSGESERLFRRKSNARSDRRLIVPKGSEDLGAERFRGPQDAVVLVPPSRGTRSFGECLPYRQAKDVDKSASARRIGPGPFQSTSLKAAGKRGWEDGDHSPLREAVSERGAVDSATRHGQLQAARWCDGVGAWEHPWYSQRRVRNRLATVADAMFTVALMARKGGTGKTTLAVHLAAAFEDARDSSAVVDRDPQAQRAGCPVVGAILRQQNDCGCADSSLASSARARAASRNDPSEGVTRDWISRPTSRREYGVVAYRGEVPSGPCFHARARPAAGRAGCSRDGRLNSRFRPVEVAGAQLGKGANRARLAGHRRRGWPLPPVLWAAVGSQPLHQLPRGGHVEHRLGRKGPRQRGTVLQWPAPAGPPGGRDSTTRASSSTRTNCS